MCRAEIALALLQRELRNGLHPNLQDGSWQSAVKLEFLGWSDCFRKEYIKRIREPVVTDTELIQYKYCTSHLRLQTYCRCGHGNQRVPAMGRRERFHLLFDRALCPTGIRREHAVDPERYVSAHRPASYPFTLSSPTDIFRQGF